MVTHVQCDGAGRHGPRLVYCLTITFYCLLKCILYIVFKVRERQRLLLRPGRCPRTSQRRDLHHWLVVSGQPNAWTKIYIFIIQFVWAFWYQSGFLSLSQAKPRSFSEEACHRQLLASRWDSQTQSSTVALLIIFYSSLPSLISTLSTFFFWFWLSLCRSKASRCVYSFIKRWSWRWASTVGTARGLWWICTPTSRSVQCHR